MQKIEMVYQPLGGENILQAVSFLTQQEAEQLLDGKKKGIAAFFCRNVIGVLLWTAYGKELILDKIAVSPQFQRQGVGKDMLQTLCRLAERCGCTLAFSFEGSSKFDPFYRFVSSVGLFYIEKQSGFAAMLRETEVKELHEKYAYEAEKRTLFFEQSERMQQDFLRELERTYPAIAEEIRDMPTDYQKELCCCSVSQGQIKAACFIKKQERGMELKLLYAFPGKGVLAAKALMQSAASISTEQPLYLVPTSENAVKILEGLCPSYMVEKYIYTAYYIGKP